MAVLCKVCGVCVDNMKGRRKRILEESQELRIMTSLLCRALPKESKSRIQWYLEEPASFLCRQCSTMVKRLTELTEKMEKDISSSFCNSNPSASTQHERDSESQPRARRRLAMGSDSQQEPECSEPPAKKMRMEECPVNKLQFPLSAATVESPPVTVVVRSARPRYFHLSRSLKKFGRFVGRGNKRSIASAAVQNASLRSEIVLAVSKMICTELSVICSDREDSILRLKSKVALENFSWERVWTELTKKAPTLMTLLQGCLPKSRRTERIQPALSMCASILLRIKNPKVNLLQTVVSILLRCGNAAKQVFTSLQKIMLTLTHQGMLGVMDKIAKDFDEEVYEWQMSLQDTLTTPSVEQASSQLTVDASGDPGNTSWRLSELGDLLLSPNGTSSTSSSVTPIPSPMLSPLGFSPISPSTPLPSVEQGMSFSPTSTESSSECITSDHKTSSPEKTTPLPWYGYVIVGDNVDKNIKRRHETMDRKTLSLHCFNSYAALDRCNFSDLSDVPPQIDPTTQDKSLFVPTDTDFEELVDNFATVSARILHQNIPALAEVPGLCVDHIPHPKQKEMSTQSTVIPLGIQLKDENKLEEMVDIMKHHHDYVPMKEQEFRVDVPESDEHENIKTETMHKILFGGDQLTIARARGAIRMREGSLHEAGRLEGLIPMIEDWHAGVCFLQVMWKRLFKFGEYPDDGTLQKIKTLINRSNIPTDPKNNVHACEDFVQVILEAYIIALGMKEFGMETIDEETEIANNLRRIDDVTKRQQAFHNIVVNMLKTVVNMKRNFEFIEGSDKDTTGNDGSEIDDEEQNEEDSEGVSGAANNTHKQDKVYSYTQELVTLCLLYSEFKDAIKEGDGIRIMRVWKYFLLVFKAAGRKNYCIEALTLLVQYHCLLSPRQKAQLLWSRCINTTGKPGMNISGDLHLEHLNRTAKKSIGHYHAPKSILRSGKCVGPLHSIVEQFNRVTLVWKPTGKHVRSKHDKDRNTILAHIQEKKLFDEVAGRTHRSCNISGSIVMRINEKNFLKWLNMHLKKLKIDHNISS